MAKASYHHGDLKAVILAQAAMLVAERGADGVSLRELARAAGVSHAAPAHHFTDRRGLFTALATEGFGGQQLEAFGGQQLEAFCSPRWRPKASSCWPPR